MTSFSYSAIADEFFKENSGLLVLMSQSISEEWDPLCLQACTGESHKKEVDPWPQDEEILCQSRAITSLTLPFSLMNELYKTKGTFFYDVAKWLNYFCVILSIFLFYFCIFPERLFLKAFFTCWEIINYFLKIFHIKVMLIQSWLGLKREEFMREWDVIPRCLLPPSWQFGKTVYKPPWLKAQNRPTKFHIALCSLVFDFLLIR